MTPSRLREIAARLKDAVDTIREQSSGLGVEGEDHILRLELDALAGRVQAKAEELEKLWIERTKEIVINGRKHRVEHDMISFNEIVSMAANGDRRTPWLLPSSYTVTWFHKNDGGSPKPGQSVQVKDGMVFNAVVTGDA